VMRAANSDDLSALFRMAEGTGSGFTNLPADRATLEAKLERSAMAFAREEDTPADDLFVFVLEDTASGTVQGTCQIFARIGSTWPFYSYRIETFSQRSKELERTIRAETLVLSTDLDGYSEVGGLFIDPQQRSAGSGSLLARSRYLFIRAHRPRFASGTLAELRGVQDDAGNSPFWDALAGRFFDMSFHEADEFNSIHGNQFIADVMPRHPIYTKLLAETARAVMGVPHRSGLAALRMLENEGFHHDRYIDIFDGGPTMIAATDSIATIREAKEDTVVAIDPLASEADGLVAHGRLGAFRACHGRVACVEGGLALDPQTAEALHVTIGDTVAYVPR